MTGSIWRSARGTDLPSAGSGEGWGDPAVDSKPATASDRLVSNEQYVADRLSEHLLFFDITDGRRYYNIQLEYNCS